MNYKTKKLISRIIIIVIVVAMLAGVVVSFL